MSDLRDWPALVLTAGLATRLRPLSNVRAKAAMPVAGTPLVGRILRWLRSFGIRRVVLNLHHRPETITGLVGDGSEFDLQVRYSWEPTVLGSAGGPRRALPLLDAERFLMINGDTLTNCDLRAVVQRHTDTGARVTMAVVPGDVERYGGVLIGAADRVAGFGKRTPDTRALHFIGVQAVHADVFAHLREDAPAETVRELYPELIRQAPDAIAAYESDAEFLDVGTARDYLSTVRTIADRERRPLDVGAACEIAPGAAISDTILWDRVTIGSGARLSRCVIADDVHVPAGAVHSDAVLVATSAGLVVSPL